ncbi:MAG: NACHT domain-containing protein [Cyanobacteria bacterium J06560_6]
MNESNESRQDLSINDAVISGQVGQAGHTLNQIQGEGNVINTIQGRDVQVLNLTVHDRIPESLGKLRTTTLLPQTQTDNRERQILLNKVKKYWIQDVLEKSLHTQVLIELGLEERLDAVKDPFQSLQSIPQAVKRSSLGTQTAAEVFDQLGEGRTLLILGKPGAGKTITLLRLAKDWIARIEHDVSQPVPVVLNLSSWALNQNPISVWVVEELSSKYQVSQDLGQTWVENQQLLLLMDGLDEVQVDRREACIQGLNQFMQDYGQTEIVVCSRVQDYESLSSRLRLQAAIYIQSLTSDQVNLYLTKAGEQLKVLKALLQSNATLRELAQSPLMLSVMSMAYQHQDPNDMPRGHSVEESCRHLFDTYIQQMFQRRGHDSRPYSKEKMVYWLTQLAKYMSSESKTIFLIEQMQPTWLGHKHQFFLYRVGTVLVSSLVGGVVFGITGGLSGGFSCTPDGIFIWNSADGLAWWLVFSGVGAVVSMLVLVGNEREIKPVETFSISWASLTKSLTNQHTLTRGWLGAMIGALGAGLCAWLTDSELLAGIFLGLGWGLVFGLVLGLSSEIGGSEIEVKSIPNQGIWRSMMNASWVGLSFGLMMTFVGQLGFGLIGLDSICRWLAGLLMLLGFGGLGIVTNEAGKACIRHFTLRSVLFSKGIIPWNYSRFLDCAVEDIFLQRSGGTYFFIHRMLMEHFSQLESIRK